MKLLIGDTGLVGRNLLDQTKFDLTFNSKNIHSFKNSVSENSEIFLSCLPATKWLVNQNVEADLENILNILNYIKDVKFSRINIISTIDIYLNSPLYSTEDHIPDIKDKNYGSNRLFFEILVEKFCKYDDLKIFRLPALFGNYLKKNIIFDLLNNNQVEKINFNSAYQWYFLKNLKEDINYFTENFPQETRFNLFPEPLDSREILKHIFPEVSIQESSNNFVQYNYCTKFNSLKYIKSADQTLTELKEFVYGSGY
jgi:nucleoside-diphosphate-sugar epimerase